MMKSKIGPVTAYADAVQAGYTGTREEFGRQQAECAKNAASVEQAKAEVKQAIESFGQTANVAKQDVIAEGDRQVQRIEDIVLDLSLDREQIANNAAGVEEAKAAAEEAKTIAKGRATGYVFDTVEDMKTWLSVEENIQNLVLGDNLYIRATDVPDYWWDGEQAQPLETQKVDMEEYVKFTDYASQNKHGIVKPNLINGIIVDSNGVIGIVPSTDAQLKSKNSNNRPIISKQIDYVSVQSAHQEMSNDYDPSTAVTPDGNVPYAYGDRQPVSYAAVKGYVDGFDDWKNTPIFETTLEEEVAYVFKKFEKSYDRLMIRVRSVYLDSGMIDQAAFIIGFTEGKMTTYLPCFSNNSNRNYVTIIDVYKISGIWVAKRYQYKINDPTPVAGGSVICSPLTVEESSMETIDSICISGRISFSAGTTFSIYGKPARKGVTT